MFRRVYLRMLARFYPQTYLKKVGVRLGKGTRVMGSLYHVFSEEAYLITIGENCLISSEVTLLTHDGSVDVFRREFPKADRIKPILIGDNVFIGHRSIVMPGVVIGSNVVIGAGSVVNKDVPDNVVYAGVPAKMIKTIGEYKEKIMSEMLETKHLDEFDKRKFLTNYYNRG